MNSCKKENESKKNYIHFIAGSQSQSYVVTRQTSSKFYVKVLTFSFLWQAVEALKFENENVFYLLLKRRNFPGNKKIFCD